MDGDKEFRQDVMLFYIYVIFISLIICMVSYMFYDIVYNKAPIVVAGENFAAPVTSAEQEFKDIDNRKELILDDANLQQGLEGVEAVEMEEVPK